MSHSDSILPSEFVREWCARIAGAPRSPALSGVEGPRRALDVAMGRGRHAAVLAALGFEVYGVDITLDAVRDAVGRLGAEGLVVRGWVADLTQYPVPRERFEAIVVSRYLQRDLFPSLRDAVTPDGFVIYETFTEHQRALGRGPTSPDHLLKPGELRSYFEGFDVLYYEEVDMPEAVARLVARRT